MSKIRVGLQGAQGKMGVAIQKELLSHSTMIWEPEWFSQVNSANVDVVIDFSSPTGLQAALRWSVQHQKPFVSGTTGLNNEDTLALKQAAQKIPVLYAANFSLGVFWLQKMLSSLKGISGFDVVIEEVHHLQKKDRPSGTALAIKDTLVQNNVAENPEVLSIRAGTVFGQHRVSLFGSDESIVVEHQAQSRSVFAKGALQMAARLVKQKPGLYRVEDLA